METNPPKKDSGFLKKLCICVVLVFALAFVLSACSEDDQPGSTNQTQSAGHTQSPTQSTPGSSSSTNCSLSLPCFGGGSDNNTMQDNVSGSPSCSTGDSSQPFCLYLDYSQLSSNGSVTLFWQQSDSSLSYEYTVTQYSLPSGDNQSTPVSGSNGNTLLNQTLNIGDGQLNVIQVEVCLDTTYSNTQSASGGGGSCYASEPMTIDTGYAPPLSNPVQTPQPVETGALCPNFCRVSGSLWDGTYYISKPTVDTISNILKTYNVFSKGKTVSGALKKALPELLPELECGPCEIGLAVLTVLATIISYYIDPLEEELNAHSGSNGVTFEIKRGFLQRDTIKVQ